MLEALAREQHSHAVWLCREFSALSFEDAEDLVAEALSRLNGDLPSQLPAARAYLRTMLHRDAIDELRHRHGRRPSEKAQRPRLVALADLSDGSEPASAQTADGELAQRAARSLSQATVQRALARLPEQERETVRMRYLDGLDPAAICEGLGLSRTQYERRLTDGIRRAQEALIADAPLEACHAVRHAISASPGALNPHDAARRDAHLEECLACRAFERRARGLLSLLPAAPTLGWWAQLRLKGETLLHRGTEAAGGAPGDAATATAAAGASVGVGAAGGLSASGLLGGAALKAAAVCSSAAVAAVCVAQLPVPHHRPDRESRTTATAANDAAQRRATPTPAATAIAPRAASTAAPTPQPPPDATPPRQRPTAKQRAQARQRVRESEFGPEGGGTTTSGSTTATAATATSPSAGTNAGSASGSEPAKATPAPADDSVSAEFSP